MLNLIFLVILVTIVNCQDSQECLSRDYGNGGTVCVCNSQYCDTIAKPEPIDSSQFLVYTSNLAGLRFQKEIKNFSTSTTDNQIILNRDLKYQKINGFGGAFTDSTGINIKSLDDDLQDKLLKSYFSDDGIEYNMCRVPIGGTDFSTHGYSYNDGDPDPELTNFALAEEDSLYKIPLIKKATELNNNLQLFASAWTAPKWMKTNGEYAGFGFLKSEYYQTWADYFVKFLDEYDKENITFWGITTGNEPHTVLVPLNQINCVGWNSTEMGKWIEMNLGPTIRNSKYSDIKIMTLDDQRFFLPGFADIALQNETARNFIDGIAVHWYMDFIIPADLLSQTHEHFPEKFLLNTEACITPLFGVNPVLLGSWERGETYSHDIIEDLLNWVTGWVDWNMVLDLTGGPTYINNFVDSPIIVNSTADEFYKQPMFYHMGHFSKFLPRDSIRIDSSSNLNNQVSVVAFERPDNSTAVIILNRGDQETVTLVDQERIAVLEISERSISTILYW